MKQLAANYDLDLTSPKQARQYIKNFKYILGKEAMYATTSKGRLIHFRNMSDEDAIFVAQWMREVEIEGKSRRK